MVQTSNTPTTLATLLKKRVAAVRPRLDKPSFHVAPEKGWVNDPNGPLFYKGYYHMFYQHVEQGCTWSFGLVWGHSVSRDLVHWEVLPHAIIPSPGGLDSDGAFSGCAALDDEGVPIIMYTGVRLRSNDSCGPLPPTECDLQLPFIESQLTARPVDPNDPKLTYWTKTEYPFLSLPPPNMGLGGWRDPYIIGRPGQDGQDHWSIVIGSGVKDSGGTILVYTSPELTPLDGWHLHGELCHGRDNGSETGFVWECPLLCRPGLVPDSLRLLPGFDQREVLASSSPSPEPSSSNLPAPHFFCISPDACTNPSYYYLGAYDPTAKEFDLASSIGPFRLDLGDVVYAPNTLDDALNNRTLLWGWAQEKRTKVDAYDYAGCLTHPRVLLLKPPSADTPCSTAAGPAQGWSLHQAPIPELEALRDQKHSWRLSEDLPMGVDRIIIDGGARLPVPVVEGPFLELELVFQRDAASASPASQEEAVGASPRCSASGLLLHSFSGAEGSAALLYHWDTGVLEVVFEASDPHTHAFSLCAPNARRVGGKLLRPPALGDALQLRVFLDSSLLEVFTDGGEVLTARVYRGVPQTSSLHPFQAGNGQGSQCAAGLDIISVDGPTQLLHAAAYEVQPAYGSGITEEEEAGAVEPLRLRLAGSSMDEQVAVTGA
ncbi:hypothetical protein HYH03_007337 [Edaphochlamys debaryana]|uniref:Uncharacterized protein n=1 Tax=Edaphochlamys debaryana TaxID=47281 RepID=A0A835Y5K2_9CHLO|nr:hypothetical protein HYH03_007337 [Edaphochlamys debaryana]|eukprot:KAG2494571.1 hypothetical protein HYH03_007337 [Edaphochlamys debaryana]